MRLSIYQELLLHYKLLQVSAEQCTAKNFRINPDKRDAKLREFSYRTFENISPSACFQSVSDKNDVILTTITKLPLDVKLI